MMTKKKEQFSEIEGQEEAIEQVQPEKTPQKGRFIELKLGVPEDKLARVLSVDREAFSIDRMDRLTLATMKIKTEFALETEIPRRQVTVKELNSETGKEVEQTREENDLEYSLRVLPLMSERFTRKQGEGDEDFVNRIHVENMKSHISTICRRVTQEICRIFDLGELSEPEFKKTTLKRAQAFIYEVMLEGAISFGGKFWPVSSL